MLRRWADLITGGPYTIICLRQSLNAGVATLQPSLEDFAYENAKVQSYRVRGMRWVSSPSISFAFDSVVNPRPTRE